MAEEENTGISEESQDCFENHYLKVCCVCKTAKPVMIDFYRCKDQKDGFDKQCKECSAKQHRKYVHTHRAEIRETRKRYFQTVTGRDVQEKASRKYYQSDKGKASNRRNFDKRRALKAGVKHEEFDSKEILKRDNYICQHCGRKTRSDYSQYHSLFPNADHITPLAVGGDHSMINMQCLCRQCNMRKSSTGIGDQLRLF